MLTEHVPVSPVSQPATRVFVEETVEIKKLDMREGIPPEGNADLLWLSLLCCVLHKNKF